jgi:methylenetetrahydrofolate--tRNA-(uracil-5-)-methyltransferase
MNRLIVIGGGLAGSEAAWQAAAHGIDVTLFEMRPAMLTEAHRTGFLGELVCSNSLRSADVMSAPGLLKKELQIAGSLIMEAAEEAKVPAGSALAVDRAVFSEFLSDAVSGNAHIEVLREEVKEIPHGPVIIATGPLTSSRMVEALVRLIGHEHLYFYDAIAPIVDAGSIDHGKVYFASRYGKGGNDYINCPMTREEYDKFFDALLEADRVNVRDFESTKVFEGCMPVEVMASRGRDTLRFGPMKPVGLRDPKTGRDPFAVVQLRPENRGCSAYNMVGFQTRIKWPEQQRVFRMIPGLEKAEFLRFGSVHRNTFVNSPLFLGEDLAYKARQDLFLAGQITGVEGYIESTAMGLVAGINAARRILGREAEAVPDTTAHGSLIRHVTTPVKNFQPSSINFGLFPPVNCGKGKELRKKEYVERALRDWEGYLERNRQ